MIGTHENAMADTLRFQISREIDSNISLALQRSQRMKDAASNDAMEHVMSLIEKAVSNG